MVLLYYAQVNALDSLHMTCYICSGILGSVDFLCGKMCLHGFTFYMVLHFTWFYIVNT